MLLLPSSEAVDPAETSGLVPLRIVAVEKEEKMAAGVGGEMTGADGRGGWADILFCQTKWNTKGGGCSALQFALAKWDPQTGSLTTDQPRLLVFLVCNSHPTRLSLLSSQRGCSSVFNQ